jgi:hypothetical protein
MFENNLFQVEKNAEVQAFTVVNGIESYSLGITTGSICSL